MEDLVLLKEFSEIDGLSGYEAKVSKKLKEHFEKYDLEVKYDNLGSIMGIKKSKNQNAKRVMLGTNLDEVGFLVKEITQDGFIKLLEIGNHDVKSLLNSRVRVLFGIDDTQEVLGIITSKVKEIKKVNDLLLDIGCSSKDEVIENGVNIGNKIILNSEFKELMGKRVSAKALSGRMGCAVLCEILEGLKDVDLEFDLYFTGISQNKVGNRGALTGTYSIKPDLAITLEVLEENAENDEKLGKGVVLCYYDKSMMPNRAVLNKYKEVCEEKNIKSQFYCGTSGSDAGWIHKMLEGCPVLKAGTLGRNLNTANEIMDIEDYRDLKKSVENFILSLNNDAIQMFKEENR
ncbi:MAG: M42 family metallopeptidase [Sarcina sp.]